MGLKINDTVKRHVLSAILSMEKRGEISAGGLVKIPTSNLVRALTEDGFLDLDSSYPADAKCYVRITTRGRLFARGMKVVK